MANGNHGLFHRMGIEAVTLEGVNLNSKAAAKAAKKKKKKYPEVDLYQMGRVIEGTFRSLNNLLERFHQSFFYYVLPSSSRYVSIGMYMPGFGVLAAGLILPGVAFHSQLFGVNCGMLFPCRANQPFSVYFFHFKMRLLNLGLV